MTAPAWPRVKAVIGAALDRPPDERAAIVRAACGDDDDLRAEVESLLAAMAQAGSFAEQPPLSCSSLDRRFLSPHDTVGPYEVIGFIGAGGMGEVYRARDPRLNRDIALKILPDELVPDADRLARFRREAQVLASLDHQNIATIYGIEESGGIQALVLELVDGPSLADELAAGAMPTQVAVPVARQIAQALAAAHAQRIVHRDLKPSNIKRRADGTVKILDFGLAKALGRSIETSPASRPAAAASLTRAGAVFGTPAYMSPEQARGHSVDARADVWAFGCVVYELLSGRRAFPGETPTDTLVAVLSREPDWNLLPAATPPSVVGLLRACLEKEPERRTLDLAAAAVQLEDPEPQTLVGSAVRQARRVMWPAAAGAVLAGTVSLSWLLPQDPALATPAVRRLQIGLPEAVRVARAQSMPLGEGQRVLAVSPDGDRVAYVVEAGGPRRLYVHSLDQVDAAAVAGTDGAFGPFFSPDGQWVGFFAAGRLKKVAVTGGLPIDLCAAPNPYGGSWGSDGEILFAADEGRRPTLISAAGGTTHRVAVKDNGGSWTNPQLLRNGTAIVTHAGGVGVLSLDTGHYRTLVDNASDGRYAPSGHLVFARGGTLWAIPFDQEQLIVRGSPAMILGDVRTEGQRAVAQAAFSRDGTLVYVPGSASQTLTRPVWVDRQGAVTPTGMPPRSYLSFSLSPEGRRLAIVIRDPTSDVWVQDFERGTLTRLTAGGNNVQPLWTADGERVVFMERTEGRATPLWVPADGSHPPERIFERGHSGGVSSFSPAGDLVAFSARASDTGVDLWVRPLLGPPKPESFLRTRSTEVGAKFSPDGRWIAYTSDESGRSEVYVRPYPGPGGKWTISTDGGEEAIWSRDGRELFYRNGNRWMVVGIRLGPRFMPGPPRALFEGGYVNVGGLSYDVTPDGQRFLLLEPAEASVRPVTHLNVVLHWFETLKQSTGALN